MRSKTPPAASNRGWARSSTSTGPGRLTFATTCPPLPEGGAAAIAGWLDRNPAARMVVIDVFAKVRGRANAAVSAYDADYAAIGYAKRLADEHAVAVVLVHHVRKAASDDFLEAVSGTNGLAGAADATLVLRRPRGEADGILYVTGRDVDESSTRYGSPPKTGRGPCWTAPPSTTPYRDTRGAIIRFVRANPGCAPKAIAEGTGISPRTSPRRANEWPLTGNSPSIQRAVTGPSTVLVQLHRRVSQVSQVSANLC